MSGCRQVQAMIRLCVRKINELPSDEAMTWGTTLAEVKQTAAQEGVDGRLIDQSCNRRGRRHTARGPHRHGVHAHQRHSRRRPRIAMAISDGARFGSSATALGLPQLSRHPAVLLAHLRGSAELIGTGHAKAGPERQGPSAVSPNLREGSPHPRMLPRWDIGPRVWSTRPLRLSAAILAAAC